MQEFVVPKSMPRMRLMPSISNARAPDSKISLAVIHQQLEIYLPQYHPSVNRGV
jgi:hypothetical protein